MANPNFNDSLPPAPPGNVNMRWQVDGNGNISAYLPSGDATSVGGIALVGDLGGTGDNPMVVGIEGVPIDGPPLNDASLLMFSACSNTLEWISASGLGGGGAGLTQVIVHEIDGGGSVPATGAKGFIQIPFNCTITGWTMLADTSGSAQITISKGTYAAFPTVSSIVASAPPNLTSAQKNTNNTLTGWTTIIAASDILSFNLDSVTTCTRIKLELQVIRT